MGQRLAPLSKARTPNPRGKLSRFVPCGDVFGVAVAESPVGCLGHLARGGPSMCSVYDCVAPCCLHQEDVQGSSSEFDQVEGEVPL